MVVNVATLENLNTVYGVLKGLIRPVEVLMVNVARGAEQLETLRFEAVNPTFLLTVGKPAKELGVTQPAEGAIPRVGEATPDGEARHVKPSTHRRPPGRAVAAAPQHHRPCRRPSHARDHAACGTASATMVMP